MLLVIKTFFLSSPLSEASGSRGVRAHLRDADGRVRPPLFVETKRTEEEGLAFLTGSDLTIPSRYMYATEEGTGCNVKHQQTHTANHDVPVTNQSLPWISAGPD